MFLQSSRYHQLKGYLRCCLDGLKVLAAVPVSSLFRAQGSVDSKSMITSVVNSPEVALTVIRILIRKSVNRLLPPPSCRMSLDFIGMYFLVKTPSQTGNASSVKTASHRMTDTHECFHTIWRSSAKCEVHGDSRRGGVWNERSG